MVLVLVVSALVEVVSLMPVLCGGRGGDDRAGCGVGLGVSAAAVMEGC